MNAVMSGTATKKKGSTVVDSWKDVVFLFHEPNRHGQIVWNVRLILGDLPPWRFGPFKSKQEALIIMNELSEAFVDAIGDLPCNVAGGKCGWSEEF